MYRMHLAGRESGLSNLVHWGERVCQWAGLLWQARLPQQAHTQGIGFNRQIETKKKLAINAIPTNHTSERSIAQSAR